MRGCLIALMTLTALITTAVCFVSGKTAEANMFINLAIFGVVWDIYIIIDKRKS